ITMFFVVIILALFLLKKIRKLGEEHHLVTVGDYTALRYGEKARIPTVISFLFSYCALTGMDFVAIASILNLTIGFNLTVVFFIFLLFNDRYAICCDFLNFKFNDWIKFNCRYFYWMGVINCQNLFRLFKSSDMARCDSSDYFNNLCYLIIFY